MISLMRSPEEKRQTIRYLTVFLCATREFRHILGKGLARELYPFPQVRHLAGGRTVDVPAGPS